MSALTAQEQFMIDQVRAQVLANMEATLLQAATDMFRTARACGYSPDEAKEFVRPRLARLARIYSNALLRIERLGQAWHMPGDPGVRH